MKCKFCGREVPEGESKCPACGASLENDNAEAKEINETQQGSGEYGMQGQRQQDQPQYGISSQGFSGQEQQNQFQYGASGQGQQNQFQYGASDQGWQGQYQYGSPGQDFQDQFQNGSWDQNQYGSPDQGFQSQYQDGGYGQNQQGQYQYGPDQANYSYGRTEGGNSGQPVKPVSGTPYMIFAIITTLFCCLPLGIAAIVFASKINPLQKAGDYAGAQEEAKKAKLATIIGMVFGGIVSIIYIGILIAGMKEYSSSDIYPTVENIREFNSDIKPLEPEDIDDDEEELDETEDIEEADEQKPPVQLAEPSSELGAAWDTFTVQVNDKILTLPCTMGELEAAGLALDTEDTPENYVVNAREYVYTYFKDANDNEVLIDIVNLTEEPKSLRECIIGGISVYDYDLENGGLTVIFPGGVQIGTPREDVIAKYGETEDNYEDDEDYSMYTWYADNAYYSYCEIDVDVETGLVCSMFMENYGE